MYFCIALINQIVLLGTLSILTRPGFACRGGGGGKGGQARHIGLIGPHHIYIHFLNNPKSMKKNIVNLQSIKQ